MRSSVFTSAALYVFVGISGLLASALPTELRERATLATTSVYNIAGDPPFVTTEAKLKAAILCPNGATTKNTVLLIPGTGVNATQFWSLNFADVLPANGFLSLCYLQNPTLSLGDAQITSEFVTYAINSLYQSTGSKVRVLSHSQGGPNVQWSITFFPSVRSKIQSFVAISPDYKGSTNGPLLTAVAQVAENGTYPSVFQQNVGSKYSAALLKHSQLAATYVPTTNIFTSTDDIVQPENNTPAASSYLTNATNILLQSLCPTRTDDHGFIVVDSITNFFTLQAFGATSGKANVSTATAAQVSFLCANALPVFKTVTEAVSFTTADLDGLLLLVGGIPVPASVQTRVKSEPAVFSYAA